MIVLNVIQLYICAALFILADYLLNIRYKEGDLLGYFTIGMLVSNWINLVYLFVSKIKEKNDS